MAYGIWHMTYGSLLSSCADVHARNYACVSLCSCMGLQILYPCTCQCGSSVNISVICHGKQAGTQVSVPTRLRWCRTCTSLARWSNVAGRHHRRSRSGTSLALVCVLCTALSNKIEEVSHIYTYRAAVMLLSLKSFRYTSTSPVYAYAT